MWECKVEVVLNALTNFGEQIRWLHFGHRSVAVDSGLVAIDRDCLHGGGNLGRHGGGQPVYVMVGDGYLVSFCGCTKAERLSYR